MTVEPTDTLVGLVIDEIDFEDSGGKWDDVRRGLVRVFAELEQDYQIARKCGDELAPGLRCQQLNGHPLPHKTRAPSGSSVTW